MASPEPSIVKYCGTSDQRICGYCWSNGNMSRGMRSDSLSVQDHQNLIDRGWRRQGKHFHKPTMNQTCCPQYSIRTDALNFKLSKSQKKVLKQVNKFLIYGISTRGAAKASGDNPDQEVRGARGTSNSNKSEFTPDPVSHSPPKPGLGADPSKPVMRKAKELRLERKKLRELEPPQNSSNSATKKPTAGSLDNEKTLAEILIEPEKAENCVHKLEVCLIKSSHQNEEFTKSAKDSFEIFQQNWKEIHNNPPHLCNRDNWLESGVHSPLKAVINDGCQPVRYGSFHQHYILDGKLIAVSVIDILPRGLSSLYCYYLPEYKFLSIGIYTALREIAFIQELNKKAPDFRYLYLGNYVHSCPKVTYKMRFSPSYLLCPETYTWIPIAECLPKLDVSKYSRLAAEGVVDDDEEQDIDTIPVIYRSETMSYRRFKSQLTKTSDDKEVLEYAILVGRCAQRMLLIRDP